MSPVSVAGDRQAATRELARARKRNARRRPKRCNISGGRPLWTAVSLKRTTLWDWLHLKRKISNRPPLLGKRRWRSDQIPVTPDIILRSRSRPPASHRLPEQLEKLRHCIPMRARGHLTLGNLYAEQPAGSCARPQALPAGFAVDPQLAGHPLLAGGQSGLSAGTGLACIWMGHSCHFGGRP